MAIFRVEKTRDYTVMSNYHLKDRSLSLKCKGLLSIMLSLPDEWSYTTRGLAAICKEGVDAIGGALKEMEAAGYLIRNKLRNEKGQITDTEYIIYERPQHKPDLATPDIAPPGTAEPDTEKPYTVKQDVDLPCPENTAQYNTNQAIPKINKNTHGSTIHPINLETLAPPSSPMDEMDTIRAYRNLIMENLEYDILCERYGQERMDELVELMLETVCSKRDYIRIAGDEFPREPVNKKSSPF